MRPPTALATVAVLVSVLCSVPAAAHAEPQPISQSLEQGWRFTKSDPAGAERPGFDAAGWSVVSVPHTWNATDWQEMTGYYRGPGWYRRDLEIPAQWKGKRVFVRFGAASTAAEVYLNGQLLGSHKGAFGAFAFELTPHVAFGGPNVLAVRVTNARADDIPPLGGDFNLFGGLYRAVTLLVRDAICVTPLDFGSPGLAARQVAVSADRAELSVTANVSNGRQTKAVVDVVVTVRDAAGVVVGRSKTFVYVGAGETRPVTRWVAIRRPHLWDGLADPYLHTLQVELQSRGVVLDRITQPLGVRSLRVDPQRGFILNGRPYPLRGVNRHQDQLGPGWALSEANQDADMRLLREIGANTVRLAHYQHSDYFYSLCDKVGMIAWAEVPMVNEVNTSPAFAANAQQQVTELIRQNINHPSIAFWSIYNEVGLRTKEDPTPIINGLYALAKVEDATRPIVAATSQGELGKFQAMVATPDAVAANLYPGWYSATPDDLGPLLDQWNAHYGSRGIAVSEYGAGGSPRQHEQGMTKRPTPTGNWHPEEWQAIQHERSYAAIVARPFVWGSWVWNMFDFASSGRSEGDTPGVNDKGLITYDRTIKKDAFFFYKANWNPEPMVYITSRRHTTRASRLTDIKVYSSCPRVSIRVNGKPVADVAGSPLHVFQWTGLTLASGPNTISAEAACAANTVTDEVTWTYAEPRGTRFQDVVFDAASVTANVPFQVSRDVVRPAGASLTLDIYSPAGDPDRRRPAILWIHGGGFRTGTDKSQKYIVSLATEFARRGYVSITPDYRVRAAALADADRVPALRDAVADCRDALLWMMAKAADLGIDPSRIAIAGGSAGGMTAVNLAAERVVTPQNVVVKPFALIDLWGSPAASIRPTTFDASYPPTLIVHGTADQTVPFAQSEELAGLLKAAGVRHELMPIPDAAHTPTAQLDAITKRVSAFLLEALPKK